MTSTDMKHLQYLDAVSASDIEVLRSKEATYQGSWKAAGGRSAWFMARRNMDRLMVMMARPADLAGFSLADLDDVLDEEEVTLATEVVKYLRDCYVQENIFAKIRERPSGEDGTVLACLRDLRRYFTLIEAEMVARGVVTPEGSQVPSEPPEHRSLTGKDGCPISMGTVVRLPAGGQAVVHAIRFEEGLVDVGDKDILFLASTLEWWRDKPEPKFVDEKPSEAAPLTDQPWVVDHAWRTRHDYHRHTNSREKADQFTIFYKNQAKDLWVLEPAVASDTPPPTQAAHLYDLRSGWYTLDIKRCPPGARDFFPVLLAEVNEVTLGELPDWQRAMYYWSADETKWRIHPHLEAWTTRG